MWYIYMHKNKINGKIYIGQSENPEKRWKNGKGYKNNIHFNSAIEKYGWDNFEHIILEKDIPTLDLALKKENYYILKYDSINQEKGYNLIRQDNKLCISETVKKKISISIKKLWQNKEYREKTLQGIKENGKYNWTEERREKMRQKIKKQREETDFQEKAKKGASEWSKKAWAEGGILRERMCGKNSPTSKAVLCITTGEIFNTQMEACKKYNIDSGSLSKACTGKLKHAGRLPGTNILLEWRRIEKKEDNNES